MERKPNPFHATLYPMMDRAVREASIAALRQAAGDLNWCELARMTGIPRSTFAKWLRDGVPTVGAVRLAACFDNALAGRLRPDVPPDAWPALFTTAVRLGLVERVEGGGVAPVLATPAARARAARGAAVDAYADLL